MNYKFLLFLFTLDAIAGCRTPGGDEAESVLDSAFLDKIEIVKPGTFNDDELIRMASDDRKINFILKAQSSKKQYEYFSEAFFGEIFESSTHTTIDGSRIEVVILPYKNKLNQIKKEDLSSEAISNFRSQLKKSKPGKKTLIFSEDSEGGEWAKDSRLRVPNIVPADPELKDLGWKGWAPTNFAFFYSIDGHYGGRKVRFTHYCRVGKKPDGNGEEYYYYLTFNDPRTNTNSGCAGKVGGAVAGIFSKTFNQFNEKFPIIE